MNEEKTTLEALSLDELEQVSGSKWVWRNRRWVWVRPSGVNRPGGGGSANRRRK